MPEYKIRFPQDQRMQDIYEKACDCIFSGEYFYTARQIVSTNRANAIWRIACYDMGIFK